MDKIKVNVIRLRMALIANREGHRNLFLKAQEGYREQVIEALDRALKNARDKNKEVSFNTLLELHREFPIDRTQDYDEAIGMLEFTSDTEVFLSHSDYRRYVLDKWEWSELANATNLKYSNR